MRQPDWQTEDGSVRLYCADCLDVLPELEGVDAVVTDPPYGIGERMQGGTWGAASKYADFRKWDTAPTADALQLICGYAAEVVIWGGNYFALPRSRCWLAWDKRNAVPTMADVELAWTNLEMPAKRFSWPVGVHEHGHPTEKPLPLMLWNLGLLKATSVIDPFMGSGTTGVACIKTGRNFVGCEIEPKYFDIAVKRIKDELERFPLLEAAPKIVQRDMLGG